MNLQLSTASDFIFTYKGQRVFPGMKISFLGREAYLVGGRINDRGYSEAIFDVPGFYANHEVRVVPAPFLGMPATVGIGSDSYAVSVSEIIFFKSGRNMGEPRGIKVKVEGNENLFKDLTFRMTKWGSYRANDHYSLTLGVARDYFDPSF